MAMSQNESYFNHSRSEMLRFIPTHMERILEVGCGTGGFMSLIKQNRQIETWGIEPSAASKQAKLIFDHVIELSVEEAVERLPDDYFDCVIFNDVLEHLVDPEEVIRVISKKLCKEGRLVCSIPNVRFLPNLYQLLFRKDWKYDPEGGILDTTHLRFFTKISIDRLMSDNGFEVEILEGINPITLLKYRIILFLTFGFFEDARFMQFACVSKCRK